jgi:hypothetical protein
MSLLLKATRISVSGVVLWVVLFASVVAFAQDPGVTAPERGVIIGTVTDAAGQRLPGVTVIIRTTTGVRTVVTDAQGRYRMAGLPLRTYRVVADLTGFLLTAKEIELTPRYPESDASFVMFIGNPEEAGAVPGRPRYRVWPLGPESR